MVNSEQEMLHERKPEPPPPERFTSLQPTYEDTVPPQPDDWELDD